MKAVLAGLLISATFAGGAKAHEYPHGHWAAGDLTVGASYGVVAREASDAAGAVYTNPDPDARAVMGQYQVCRSEVGGDLSGKSDLIRYGACDRAIVWCPDQSAACVQID